MLKNIQSILALVLAVMSLSGVQVKANTLDFGAPGYKDDSVTVEKWVSDADEALKTSNYDHAKITSSKALALSKKLSYLKGEARSSYILGAAFNATGDYNESVKNYLVALKVFEILSDDNNIVSTNASIGAVYQRQQAYPQSIKYFEKALEKVKAAKKDRNQAINLLENIAFSNMEIQDYGKAMENYNQILSFYKRSANKEKIVETYQKLSAVSQMNNQYRSAQKYNTQLAGMFERDNDLAGLSTVYNNLGFIYKRTNDLKTSVDYFTKVAELVNRQSPDLSIDDKATLYINTGVAYSNLKSYAKARENYLKALKVREKEGNEVLIADAKNYLAGGYYISGNSAQALKTVNSAISLAEVYNAKEVLSTSYKILYLLYDKEGNTAQAKKYLDKHNELRRNLEEGQKVRQQELLEKQLAIEKGEEEIRTLIEEEERLAMESERKENELKIKEKELAILKRDQELREVAYKNQVLEKQRTEQALAFAQQQLEAEKRERELASLEKEKELQSLELKRKALEDEQQEKAIALLEADKKLKDKQLEKEEAIRKYGYGIIGLFTVILAFIVYSFIQKKKANKQLEKQRHEIAEKNEELQQNMEELQTTQDALQLQKNQLEVHKGQLESQNKKITYSIQYAQKIQQSILPTVSSINKLFPINFVTYLPKDIVSGDFYWMAEIGSKKVLAIVDCTGHGVPGALVSMVGSNILNELVNQRRITDPAVVLNKMHEELRIKLNQEESQNHDGMDLGICVLEDIDEHQVKMIYAGAKHTLFGINRGDLLEVDGDRKSIGGANSCANKDFTNKEVILEKGAQLYLTTDGFIDQNSPQRRRFNKKNFKALLEKVYHLDILDQQKSFEEALANHQQGEEQRDDITLLGVRV